MDMFTNFATSYVHCLKENRLYCIGDSGFEGQTLTLKVAIFWDIVLFSQYIDGRWFLARLIFGSENGGDTFFRNVGLYTDYTAVYPKRMTIFTTTAVRTSNHGNINTVQRVVSTSLLTS
jgi:hypothetical protein